MLQSSSTRRPTAAADLQDTTSDPYRTIHRTMELGKLVAELTATYLACDCDWPKFVSKVQNSLCLHHFIQNLPHPAAKYLGHLQTIGVPIHCLMPDWTLNRRNDAAHQGSHQSARQYLAFSESEMADMIQKGYWVVLPYTVLKNLPNLRLSSDCPQWAWSLNANDGLGP